MDDSKLLLAEQLQQKWAPVLEHEDLPKIPTTYKKNVTTVLLENQKKAAKPRKKKLTTLGKAVFIVAKLGNSYNTFQHFYYRPPAENRLVDIFNFDPR